MKSLRAFAVAVLFIVAAPAVAQPQITDDQIAKIVVQASRDAYYRTGRPCACPDDLARNGSAAVVAAHIVGRAAPRRTATRRTCRLRRSKHIVRAFSDQ
jgi:hypothetical protein